MATDKGIMDSLRELANAFGKLMKENSKSTDDKNNAEICAIVKKMMLYKDLGDDDIDIIIQKLEPIYEGEHRHSYSNISSTIYAEKERMDLESKKDGKDNEVLDILGVNITKLHKRAIKRYSNSDSDQKEKFGIILKKFHKLYDHINLEIVRLKNYDDQIKRAIDRIQESSANTEERLKLFNEKMTETSKEIEVKLDTEMQKVRDESEKLRAEYISILGIFSAVVLAFVGGMAFSTSVLENVNKASAYRLVLIALIIGIVFFNIIWILLDFIRSMQEKRYIWIVVNAMLVLAIISSCFAYKYDWFAREEQINQYKNQQIEQEINNSTE